MTLDKEIIQEIVSQVAKIPMKDILDDLEVLLPDDIAKKFKLSKTTIYHYIEAGDLPAFKIGGLRGPVRCRPRAVYASILYRERMGMGEKIA